MPIHKLSGVRPIEMIVQPDLSEKLSRSFCTIIPAWLNGCFHIAAG